jgi:hypothetical protein
VNKKRIDYRHYALNAGIMFPSIFLLVYISTYIIQYISVTVIVIFILIFFLKYLVPRRFRQYVYPTAIIIFLLLLLNTLSLDATNSVLPFLSDLSIPLSFSTLSSLTFSIGLVTVMEGIIAPRYIVTISEFFGSLLLFIELLGIVAVMLTTNPAFLATESGVASYLIQLGVYNPNAYIVAFFTTMSLEGYALYTLIVYGYQFYLPLTVLSTPVDSVMPFLLMVSAASILIALYMREKRNVASRLGTIGLAGIAGALVALPLLLISEELASYGFQIFVIAASVAALLIVTAVTSRKVPATETINTFIK